MILFLHIGSEKTGSSFIQSTLARNRDHLRNEGILYPTGGKREKDMLAGRISPGNAKYLTLALLNDSWEDVLLFIRHSLKLAKSEACKGILLSNENLIEPLSSKVKLDKFLALCYQEGFTFINVLLVLRDPADQALSLFKHRAKDGLAPELEEWLLKGYHLPGQLNSFIPNVLKSKVSLMVRKYQEDSRCLTVIFFQDWLNVAFPPVWEDIKVNSSLTLSELVLLKKIRISQPILVDDFYQAMLAVPKNNKSDDFYIKKYSKTVIDNYLSQYNDTWKMCDQLLPVTEKLQTPAATVDIQPVSKTLSFSDAQIINMVQFWKKTGTLSFSCKLRVRDFWRLVKVLIRSIRR